MKLFSRKIFLFGTIIFTATASASVILSSCSNNSGDFEVIPSNNLNIVYSPYNWYEHTENGAVVQSSYPGGAYIKVKFEGSTIGLQVYCSSSHNEEITMNCYIDGSPGLRSLPIVKTLPPKDNENLIFANNLGNTTHYAEIYISKTTEHGNRWEWEDAVNVKSILLQKSVGHIFSNDHKYAKKALIYGDSITESIAGGAEYQSTAELSRQFGYEYGQVGWGYEAFSENHGKYSPMFWSETGKDKDDQDVSWNHYCNGHSRMTDPTANKSFISGEPDVIFNNLGVNDSWDKDTSPTKTCSLYEGWLDAERQRETSLGEKDIGEDGPLKRPMIFMIMPYRFGRDWGSDADRLKEWHDGFDKIYTDCIANSFKNLFLLDLGKYADTIIGYNSSDDLHPDAAGNFAIALYTLIMALIPKAPIVNSVTSTSTSITIKWEPNIAPANQYYDVSSIDTSYIIKWKKHTDSNYGPSNKIIMNNTERVCTFYPSSDSKDYDVKVVACNDLSDSVADSAEYSISTKP